MLLRHRHKVGAGEEIRSIVDLGLPKTEVTMWIKQQPVGFFRELEDGGSTPESPSIVEARGRLDPELAPKLASYIRAGRSVVVAGGGVDDWFDPARKWVAPLHLRTDGVWYWPEHYAYYVENYLVDAPAEFIAHARRNRWRIPPKAPAG